MKRLIICSILLILHSAILYAQDIHQAAKNGNLERVKEILDREPQQIKAVDEVGYTALHWALIRARWETAEFLIGRGADLNIQGTEGGAPLHCAANHDNIVIINEMLAKGAKMEVKNLWGNTPLNLAVQRGCLKTVEYLISKGADIQTKSNEGWTPLHYAYKSGQKKLQKYLIEAGASQTEKDTLGKIPTDYDFTRPAEITIDNNILNDYTGYYHLGGDSYINITNNQNRLMLEEFALDEIYPIALDQFYDRQEPWKIRFFRNKEGRVDRIAVDFQRQTIIGKKVKSRSEKVERPRLGIRLESLTKEKTPVNILEKLFFELKLNSNVQLVTFVQPGSVADKAGIKENDIIIEFFNKVLYEPGDIQIKLYDIPLNVEIPVKILRNGKIIVVNMLFHG